VQEVARVDLHPGPLGAADVEPPDAALVVGGHRDALEHPLDLLLVEALLSQPFARQVVDQALGAGACRHPLGLDSGEGPGPPL
jgi:hypothetical protein